MLSDYKISDGKKPERSSTVDRCSVFISPHGGRGMAMVEGAASRGVREMIGTGVGDQYLKRKPRTPR